MNAVTHPSINFMEENGGGSDSDANSDESPNYYQPISAGDDNSDASDSDDVDSQFHPLPNGYSNGVRDDEEEETKRREEEEREREREVAARREDESRRRAPLTAENSMRVVEAMRGVVFTGVPPVWAEQVPEQEWIDRLRRAREPNTVRRH